MNEALVMAENVSAGLARVRQRITQAAERSGRPSGAVRLIAVTKGFPLEAAVAAVNAGVSDVGENRVQEAEPKIGAWPAGMEKPTWHLIGHLQTNKARRACSLFDQIHSVDSVRLARTISQYTCGTGGQAGCLLEVNVSGEESKYGFTPEELTREATEIAALSAMDWLGLMTIAPLAEAESSRPIFRQLAELKNSLADSFAGYQWDQLSMGMTNDFEIAIEEGATAVRVGQAIFGERISR